MLRSQKEQSISNFIECFHSLEESSEFPFMLAINSFDDLEKTADNETDFLNYLLEDCIFISLYATFYEQLFLALKQYPHLIGELLDKFSETAEERESLIAKKTNDHIFYIEAGGECSGCSSCENHKDVYDLIPYWNNRDINFFINLYVLLWRSTV